MAHSIWNWIIHANQSGPGYIRKKKEKRKKKKKFQRNRKTFNIWCLHFCIPFRTLGLHFAVWPSESCLQRFEPRGSRFHKLPLSSLQNYQLLNSAPTLDSVHRFPAPSARRDVVNQCLDFAARLGRHRTLHILQRCPLLRTARTNVWPTAVQLHTKLYGSKEELEKTATVILQTGLSV